MSEPTAPERAREAIAARYGDTIATSVLAILDDLGLAVRRRQPGDKRWATIARRLRADEAARERHAHNKRHDKLRAQNSTMPTAGRRGLTWTGPELEIVARTDLTAEQAAQMLGRTYHGVAMQRRKLGIDPRKRDLAGERTSQGEQTMADVEWTLPVHSGDVPPEPTAEQTLRPLPIEFCDLCDAELSTHYGLCNGREGRRE